CSETKSQMPIDARHTVPAVTLASTAGQIEVTPSQYSGTSHKPASPGAAGRQIVVSGATVSGGHSGLLPVAASGAKSQPPGCSGRHSVPLGWNVLAGHTGATPSHTSC